MYTLEEIQTTELQKSLYYILCDEIRKAYESGNTRLVSILTNDLKVVESADFVEDLKMSASTELNEKSFERRLHEVSILGKRLGKALDKGNSKKVHEIGQEIMSVLKDVYNTARQKDEIFPITY